MITYLIIHVISTILIVFMHKKQHSKTTKFDLLMFTLWGPLLLIIMVAIWAVDAIDRLDDGKDIWGRK